MAGGTPANPAAPVSPEDRGGQAHEDLCHRRGGAPAVFVQAIESGERRQGADHILGLFQRTAGSKLVGCSQLSGQGAAHLQRARVDRPDLGQPPEKPWVCRPPNARLGDALPQQPARVAALEDSCGGRAAPGFVEDRLEQTGPRSEAVVDRQARDAGLPGHGPDADRLLVARRQQLASGGQDGGSSLIDRLLAPAQPVASPLPLN
jgi:hypothetical protein